MERATGAADTSAAAWKDAVFAAPKGAGVTQPHDVPDVGHARAIGLAHADPDIAVVALTTEEEGVAACAGARLGWAQAAPLMRSSGVGNCINMLSRIENSRFPMLMLVTMRGEWDEFNPWQVPMGRAAETMVGAPGVRSFRLERPEHAGEVVSAADDMAYGAEQAVAVLLAQRLIGRKLRK